MGYHSKDLKGVYKLELTFRRNTFDKNEIDISDMTKQEQCIELLRGSAIIEILKLKGGEAVKQLQFNFITENNILARIIKLENKLENESQRTEQRFAGIENELKELRRALVKQRTK
jgi:hypothetical protein